MARTIIARYAGTCSGCDEAVAAGDTVNYNGRGNVSHVTCDASDYVGPTTRERRAARAERLRDWADKREVKSDAAYADMRQTADMIPLGQPILVGHHSERRHRNALERIDNKMRATVEHARKAEEMRSRADNIEHAADRAIYDDDPDAIERLRAKLERLEAERDRWNAYNKTCRKAKRTDGPGVDALALLDDRQREDVASMARINWWALRPDGRVLEATKNLAGNIARARQRLARLERMATMTADITRPETVHLKPGDAAVETSLLSRP